MKMNQKGLGLVEVLLIILITTVLGAAGYYVWNENRDSNSAKLDQPTSELSRTEADNNDYDTLFAELILDLGYDDSDLSDVIFIDNDKARLQFESRPVIAAVYNDGEGWKEAYSQGDVPLCSEVSNVPLEYRPTCYDTVLLENVETDNYSEANPGYYEYR